jgi:hypothetical protein
MWGALQGLGVTLRHLLRNWPLNLFGLRAKSQIVTLAYPEEKRPYPPRHRGRESSIGVINGAGGIRSLKSTTQGAGARRHGRTRPGYRECC